MLAADAAVQLSPAVAEQLSAAADVPPAILAVDVLLHVTLAAAALRWVAVVRLRVTASAVLPRLRLLVHGLLLQTTKRVWVPNVRTETVTVPSSKMQTQVLTYTVFEQQATQVPYECTKIVYQPESRSGTKQVVDYVDETRTRMRKEVQYSEESRTRTRKELSYKMETRTETIPYVTYTTEPRTKEVQYTYHVPEYTLEPYEVTRYDRVCEDVVEEYTVDVSYCTTEERKVQVARMVPKLVPVTISPCCDAAAPGPASAGAGAGCCVRWRNHHGWRMRRVCCTCPSSMRSHSLQSLRLLDEFRNGLNPR